MQYLDAISKTTKWSLFISKAIQVPIHSTVIQVYAPSSNAEEAKVERFYEDLQDLWELTPKKDVLFIIEDWNAKVGSKETLGVTGKFGLGTRNEAGQRLIEFCKENALVIANTLFQQHKSLLQHHSSKASILRPSPFFTVQLSHPYMTTGKTIALIRRTFVGKVMSLLLNTLSRLDITFLPRSVF